ncbi:MAG TPA: amidohydrolase family protein, partial [Methanocorpusculum sp.]|nr:amidohydrolase family protein [Methanocorpusculum sp.]
MNNRKLTIIGAAILVVICCIIAAGCTSEDSAYHPAQIYDFENHYYNSEFLDYLTTRSEVPYLRGDDITYREGLTLSLHETGPSLNSEIVGGYAELTDLDQIRLEMMKNAGLTSTVVSSSEGIEFVDKENAVKYARLTNDALAEAAKQHPGQIIGTITLPTPYVEESIAELERCVNELGLQYWETHSNYGAETLADEKFEPLLAKCAELNVPIYLHPAYPSDEYLLEAGTAISTACFGFSADTMKTLLMLITNGIFDRYPNLQVLVGHIGEYF